MNSEPSIRVLKGDVSHGPFNRNQFLTLLSKGKIKPTDNYSINDGPWISLDECLRILGAMPFGSHATFPAQSTSLITQPASDSSPGMLPGMVAKVETLPPSRAFTPNSKDLPKGTQGSAPFHHTQVASGIDNTQIMSPARDLGSLDGMPGAQPGAFIPTAGSIHGGSPTMAGESRQPFRIRKYSSALIGLLLFSLLTGGGGVGFYYWISMRQEMHSAPFADAEKQYMRSWTDAFKETIKLQRLPQDTKSLSGGNARIHWAQFIHLMTIYLAKAGERLDIDQDTLAAENLKTIGAKVVWYEQNATKSLSLGINSGALANHLQQQLTAATKAFPVSGSRIHTELSAVALQEAFAAAQDSLLMIQNTVTTTPERGEGPFAIVFEISLEAISAIEFLAADFELEALDRSGKVVGKGFIDHGSAIPAGKKFTALGLIAFNRFEIIPEFTKISVSRKPDPAFLAFENQVKAALESGNTVEVERLTKSKKPAWNKRFASLCKEYSTKDKPTIRQAVAAAYGQHLLEFNDDPALLLKLADDPDAGVALASLSWISNMPKPLGILVEKAFNVAIRRKDSVKGDLFAILAKFKPESPELRDLYIKMSGERDTAARTTALQGLTSIILPQDKGLPLAVQALKEKESALLLNALTILGNYSETARSQVMEASFSHLGSPFLEVRQRAVTLVDKMQPVKKDDLPVLGRFLEDPSPTVRARACVLTGSLGKDSATAFPALLKLLDDQTDEVRIEAVIALGKQGPVASMATQKLISLAASPTSKIRTEAIRSLGSVSREPPVVATLLDALADSDPSVSSTAETTLRDFKPGLGTQDANLLEDRTAHPSARVRRVVFRAVESMKAEGRPFSTQVEKALTDSDQDVVLSAVKAMTHYPDTRPATLGVISKLAAESTPAVSRNELASACMRYLAALKGGKAASEVATIRKVMLSNTNKDVIESTLAAVKSLEKEGSVLIPDMLKIVAKPPSSAPTDNIRNYVLAFMAEGSNTAIRETIAAMGPAAAKELGKALYSPDPQTRLFTVSCLQTMGADAKDAMAALYRITVPANERVPVVLLAAKEAYGRLDALIRK